VGIARAARLGAAARCTYLPSETGGGEDNGMQKTREEADPCTKPS
jgi:hypothetical protein